MGFNEFMTKLFGNKSQRDLKEITPYVDKVKAVYPSIKALSNDELRAKTDEIKQRIQDYVAEEKAQVEELRKGIEDKELEEREAIWAEVDKIEKAITDKMEVVLEQSLPEVFAIMKDTARRFAENEEVVVTASERDRLSVNNTLMGTMGFSQKTIKAPPPLFGESDIVKTLQLTPGVASGTE